ncbi:MAG: RagB/SusD family nutrient uptake outer membrane protein [Bacteroidales bacterium]|jgi:hypothetical protein|nr:RagB/SusD family nutrient uptake outer membrane protein [Bacteroidales bacterium]
MKNDILLIAIVLSGLVLNSCEKLLEPAYDNSLSDDFVWNNPIYAEGVLLRAYTNMPGLYNFTSDMATDDAVSNEKGSGANRLSDGQWSSQYNPISNWSVAYSSLFSLNYFLENMHRVKWSYRSTVTDTLHARRLKGEAFGLRAWYQFQLLQGHSGFADGELLGFPIVTKVLKGEDFKIPRGSYQACVNAILSDCDSAINLLPAVYENIKDVEVDNAMGIKYINRINGRTVHALKSRVLLYAASPAHNPGNDLSKWEKAMKVSYDLINSLGGVAKLPPKGIDFYKRYTASTLSKEPELIWYSTLSTSSSMEADNFPPSHFGDGRLNPSQELVDAFPATDGYPIKLSAVYNSLLPYQKRDARLEAYIIYNGSSFKGKQIYTHTGNPIDGINAQETSTRTGYYLRKFMNESVLLDPLSASLHSYTYIRVTEVYLNFAEAANEFGGPTYTYNGISALTVMQALRNRAKITNHSYINGLDQAGLREAIQNERRIELCFEGHRFWDIRRWNLVNEMTHPVSGIFMNPDLTYKIQEVAQRAYMPHMIYGPIPYNEILKMGIKQNDGW